MSTDLYNGANTIQDKMQEQAKRFLEFIEKELNPEQLSIENWKTYLANLPTIYSQDITFRLLFDWHWDLSLNVGRAGITGLFDDSSRDIFKKQINLISGVGNSLYGLEYQYQELIKCHARCNLRGKKLVEIGGSLPNDLLFEHLGVEAYTNIESPDYIEAESGRAYTQLHGEHERRNTIYCNAEAIDEHIEAGTADTIFSVACFEHIYDLPKALAGCHTITREKGNLYSFFAPIYSRIDEGDHGVIPAHEKLSEKPIGFHLLPTTDQREKLINAGISNPQEIQDFLGNVNFNRIPNRLFYEDYEQLCTESPWYVVELARQEEFNICKRFPNEFKAIRRSNSAVRNMMTHGFRIHLMKITS